MSKILIVAEHLDGKLNPSTARCVSCACSMVGMSVSPATFSNSVSAVAQPGGTLFLCFVIANSEPEPSGTMSDIWIISKWPSRVRSSVVGPVSELVPV